MLTRVPNDRRAALRSLPVVALMGLVFVLSSRNQLPPIPGLTREATAAAGHVAVYAALTTAVWWALPPRPLGRRNVAAFLLAVAYGLSDEIHQAFVTGRTPQLLDVALDAVGAAGALALMAAIQARSQAQPRLVRGPSTDRRVLDRRPSPGQRTGWEFGRDPSPVDKKALKHEADQLPRSARFLIERRCDEEGWSRDV